MNAAVRARRTGTVLVTALVAGTLDAAAASGQYLLSTGKSPAGVWRYVASAVLRADAAVSPDVRVLTGLMLHYAIAVGWTLVFVVLWSRVSWMRGRPWIIGPVYALLVWVVMNRILVPLTLIGPPRSFDPARAATGAAILVVCIGLPIAFGIDRLRR